MKKSIGLLFLFFSYSSFGQHSAKYADSIRIQFHIPQLSYAVVTEDSILEMVALGHHAIHLADTATLNDRFHLGSNTKALTAFLVARSVEKGKLNWNTKFFDLFPSWKNLSKPCYYSITLQDLLTHRARIQPFQGADTDPKIPNFKGNRQQKRLQFGQFVLGLNPVEYDSTQTFHYSNAGYTLATLMLEKVTGQSWEKIVQQVFNKEMKLDVQFSWPENQKHKDTWGHMMQDTQLVAMPSTIDYHLDYTEPAGDLNIKLKDYVRFIQLNLQGLQGKNNFLKATTYQYLLKGVENYALGWYNIIENKKEMSTHSGTAGTYYTLVHIDRTANKAYIIFTNAFNPDTQQGVRLLMRHLKEQ